MSEIERSTSKTNSNIGNVYYHFPNLVKILGIEASLDSKTNLRQIIKYHCTLYVFGQFGTKQ